LRYVELRVQGQKTFAEPALLCGTWAGILRRLRRSGKIPMKKSDAKVRPSTKDSFGRALAIFSLVISIGGTFFSIYQWREGQADNAIAAAVQLSSDEEKDSGIARLRATYADFMNNRGIDDQNRVDKGYEAASFILHLDLLAERIDSGTLNEAYISFMVKCELTGNYRAVYLQKTFKPGVIPRFLPSPQAVTHLAAYYDKHKDFECTMSGP
jgi:hypothetical protein